MRLVLHTKHCNIGNNLSVLLPCCLNLMMAPKNEKNYLNPGMTTFSYMFWDSVEDILQNEIVT